MAKRKKKYKEQARKPSRMTPITWIVCVVLLIYACCLMYPYLLAVLSSFKSLSNYTDNFFSVTEFTLENFKRVLTGFVYPVILKDGGSGYYDFLGLTVNSFLYAAGGALCLTVTPCVVAYCCQKYPYKFSKFIEALIYVVMIVPIIGNTASTIQMTQNLGTYDTMWGHWFMKCSFLGVYFLVYHAAFEGIPNDYSEAVYMDGGGHFTIFFRIMLPLVSKQMLTVFILQFVALWSDYMGVLYYLPSTPTISVALLNFSSLASTTAPMQLAACLLASLPSLALFAKFSDQFMGSLQMGGVKG